MLSTSFQRLLFRASPLALMKVPDPGTQSEESERFDSIKRQAQDRGFGSRDSAEDKIFMNKTFSAPETVQGVAVANLPQKTQEVTEFDQYQRSTTDFTSFVTPHGVSGTGLGAGFGAKEDKRLGFLRPRKPLQPFTGSANIVPKYDENGYPVEETLTRDQMIKKRLEYMKSIDGSAMSQREHFLLADLDYEKDAVLFGRTREEFERNVTKLKNVIISYNKWERTDNFYYYCTILLKLTTVWVAIETIQQYYDLKMLESNYDLFATAVEAEIAELGETRQSDFERAALQLKHSSPNFQVVLDAISAEKRAIEEAAKSREMDCVAVASDSLANVLQGASTSSPQSDTPLVSALDSPRYHPMDTTREEEMKDTAARQEQLREMQRLRDSAVKAEEYSLVRSLWHKIRGGEGTTRHQPLQQEDFVRYSYAASPTSIEAVRCVRRILLPRSEDYTQIVREEMLAYRQKKANVAEVTVQL